LWFSFKTLKKNVCHRHRKKSFSRSDRSARCQRTRFGTLRVDDVTTRLDLQILWTGSDFVSSSRSIRTGNECCHQVVYLLLDDFQVKRVDGSADSKNWNGGSETFINLDIVWELLLQKCYLINWLEKRDVGLGLVELV